jgi:hypothetical protein
VEWSEKPQLKPHTCKEFSVTGGVSFIDSHTCKALAAMIQSSHWFASTAGHLAVDQIDQ